MSLGKFMPENSMSVFCHCCKSELPVEHEKQMEWIEMRAVTGGGPTVYFCNVCGQIVGAFALKLDLAQVAEVLKNFEKSSVAKQQETEENK
jgi:hypothetical protein